MKHETTGEAALYLWDYFYIANYPTDNERKVWRRIECATIRIRESEPYLADKYPAPIRLTNAKRVRRAVREIVRLVGQLESPVATWVATVLGTFEGLAERVIEQSRDEAREHPLH